MTLFLSLLPIYIFGNLHCMGMCGPLVMMIGQHQHRYFYFLGRMVSFSLAGLTAGAIGEVLHFFLNRYYLSALVSLLFGGVIICLGIYSLLGWQYPGYRWLSCKLGKVNRRLSLLILKDRKWPTFLFGFFTLALPCGQTLVVFSACALTGDALIGMVNGFAFALLTSPSLWMAMHMHSLLAKVKPHYQTIMGVCALMVGVLACCRGLAEADVISHWIVNPQSPAHYHIVIY